MFRTSRKRHSIGAAVALCLALAGCTPFEPPAAPNAPGAGAGAPPKVDTRPPAPTAAKGSAGASDGSDERGKARSDDSPAALQGWADDDLAGLAGAIEAQCALARPPAPWPRLCGEFRSLKVPLGDWLARRFQARALRDDQGGATGLITGYHEPELVGSRTRVSASQVPLYRAPAEAVLRQRPTRARIETEGLLAGSELVWLDDRVEAFFLHVQGSGRIRLRDGSVMRVGYAGNNGQPYRSIGSVLVARGALALDEVDAGRIKAWLRANPAAATEVLHANPRYIFFRELAPRPGHAGPSGPPGSLAVPLTPMRSVAVDPKRVPPGALLWLETTDPIDATPMRRVVIAQDTGAAILGTVRADLFWGTGERAARGAGLMKQPGRLWLLEPRP